MGDSYFKIWSLKIGINRFLILNRIIGGFNKCGLLRLTFNIKMKYQILIIKMQKLFISPKKKIMGGMAF